ncbi:MULTISPECIES: DNA-directed RNA polymerase subunit delta [Nosocomiicoccus]|uniref:Probable DNA-directed RNA polymerase subunit delta n=1 Tax=Nosocomiicoccus massiliensis TaxID=1232430 RepID=A0AAF1BUS0_9STAP|nr:MULTISPECIES: DNA-directed RNA polymerase subunit delta [Nosocomiicoccus]MDK6863875.1 DNA-directed RNA polymerase subunit delta [Nosocomiicoccus ampullae]OFL49080.1 DNA-directed RNA polymerase subunit delta [Nosocomiicoccus sp. HMSC067E10]OFO52524.1 DNA-directed RNA polymerase subunit delta [Nosocomiicoccus sp. HMSC059G07]OFS63403.1 DNA-directed RNA polymerase subunit delta [Nosocomiicoccus sp. HMSC09A07]WOS95421.1 DNA-directed RNA polymerase subunit delta [Nosocomiicoccus massiliensis]
MRLDEFTKEMIDEQAFIDMAYIYLDDLEKETDLYSIIDKFQEIGGYTEKEIENRILQFYTDLNTDGRFVSTEDGVWGLRKWFTVDDINDKIAPTVHKFEVVDNELDEFDELDEELDDEDIEDIDEEDDEDIDEAIDDEDIDTTDLNIDEGDTLEDDYGDGDDY